MSGTGSNSLRIGKQNPMHAGGKDRRWAARWASSAALNRTCVLASSVSRAASRSRRNEVRRVIAVDFERSRESAGCSKGSREVSRHGAMLRWEQGSKSRSQQRKPNAAEV